MILRDFGSRLIIGYAKSTVSVFEEVISVC